ncbi:hypothetical protein JK159_06770 [Weissella minor]|uniref:hypothetical protein n=1 Tax=Weissella minor TaxID=1620 RepID=UPI001BAED757|nr:hypothetical protein [Weissella minor]MBS0950063.1 hypothetical protein [Weissella minor]
MTDTTMDLADVLADMQEQDIEPPIPAKWATPNEFIYRKYNRQTKVFLEGTNEACDSTDEIFATTKVALPEGDLNFVFREDVQMWQGYTAEQLDDYLDSIYVPKPTGDDQWKMAMMQQNALLFQQNKALTQTSASLSTRVAQLEQKQMEEVNNG